MYDEFNGKSVCERWSWEDAMREAWALLALSYGARFRVYRESPEAGWLAVRVADSRQG